MPRGMRVIEGDDALQMTRLIDNLRSLARAFGCEEVIIPSVWEQETFTDKAGPEVLSQMYTFDDKKGRPLCLIPEVTAVIQELWRTDWSKRFKQRRIFYISRCYRYERPQAGRYREFTQFGVELLGDIEPTLAMAQLVGLARDMTAQHSVTMNLAAQRGLDYYTEDGFEFSIESLGAQKQVLGGGRYESGIGFAIGVDRLLLAERKF